MNVKWGQINAGFEGIMNSFESLWKKWEYSLHKNVVGGIKRFPVFVWL